MIYWCVVDTAIGKLSLTANEKVVTSLRFGGFFSCDKENVILMRAKTELCEYFLRKRQQFTVPVFLGPGTVFQKKVWNTLTEIPFGQTKTYSEVADIIGTPKAQRAVGGACNKNPVPIFVPCHRVIGKKGSLVGFAGGIDIKKQLLLLETT